VRRDAVRITKTARLARGDGRSRAALLALAVITTGALASCTPESPSERTAVSAVVGGEAAVPAPESDAAPVSEAEISTSKPKPGFEPLDPTEAALPYPSFTWPPSDEALAAGFDTPTELAWMAIQAIDREDHLRMKKLLIDESTYMEKLWPSFEAEKPGSTVPAQFHWDHLEMKSLSGMLDMTREYAGKGLRLRTVTHESVENYVVFKLYRRTRVLAEDPMTGKVEEYELFGTIVEIDGKHKLLSYPS
jgi:hypothetical protein